MSDTYQRKTEKKFCYFTKGYVQAVIVRRKWRIEDGSWVEKEAGVECPNVLDCRRAERNCLVIHPKTGIDPFSPFRNLLADMW